MRHFNLGLVTFFAALSLAVACGDDDDPDFESNGGSAGTSSGGKGGTANGGTGGTGKGGSAGSGVGGEGAIGGADTEEGGAGGEGGTPEPVGPSLTVVIENVPAGSSPQVTVTGPDGFSETISKTTTFTELEPGEYTVTTDTEAARVDGTLIDRVFDVEISGSPADVDDGKETIEISWGQRPGTGMLWLGNYDSTKVLGYRENQLGTSNDDLAPAVVLDMPALGTDLASTGAIAFDARGWLWVGYCEGGNQAPQAIAGFSPGKLAASGSPEADVVITTPNTIAHDCVGALAPDPDGGLWVGFLDAGVAKYTAEQLEEGGDIAPSIAITGTGFAGINDILLDPEGNLWVAAYVSNRINKLGANQLGTSNATVTPTLFWDWSTGGVNGPDGLAWKAGNTPQLWASFYDGGYIGAFASSTASGTDPAEAVTLTGDTIYNGAPAQLTFDEQGNLWAAFYDVDKLAKIDAADLVTGEPEPSVVIGGSEIFGAYGVRLNPPVE